MKLEPEIDALYALPRAEFIAARNELAKRLRAAGDRGASDRVRTLGKPSIAAWAVNVLFHTERKSFDRLLRAAAAQRRALAGGRGSRSADGRKREALAALLRLAEPLLADAGSRWTPALRQRVHRTLESVAAAPPDLDLRPGRLTEDLQPAGFDVLAGASITPPPKAGARSKAGRKRPSAAQESRRAELDRKIRATKSELTRARRAKTTVARALARTERRAADARAKATKARRQAETAAERADELDLALRKAKADLERAASAVARIEARLATESRKAESLG